MNSEIPSKSILPEVIATDSQASGDNKQSTDKVNLLGLSLDKMVEFFESIGEKKIPSSSGDEVDSSVWH